MERLTQARPWQTDLSKGCGMAKAEFADKGGELAFFS
jgi:hypothetical protein